jgi:hypothetical protein
MRENSFPTNPIVLYVFFFLTYDNLIFYSGVVEKEVLIRIRYSFISTVRI